jgi:hypothetical protein
VHESVAKERVLISAFQGNNASKKRKRQYPDGLKDGSIPKPPGTAGKGGGHGYNLQDAMGLSGKDNDQIYQSLIVSIALWMLGARFGILLYPGKSTEGGAKLRN